MVAADNTKESEGDEAKSNSKPEKATARRDIPGNMPYTTTSGKLREILQAITTAERPDKFSADFMATVLKFTGGSAKPVPPILKRMGFLNSDATPTELYAKFKSDGGRSAAALKGLKSAYSEIFRRNEFAHKATEKEVKDIIVEITGLNKTDSVVRVIYGTFDAIRSFVDPTAPSEESDAPDVGSDDTGGAGGSGFSMSGGTNLGLTYNINIVLPETTNIQVFNAIFLSLQQNLLKNDHE